MAEAARATGGTAADGFILTIGAPLILAMTAVELKAVVAHTLAVLREPDPELADALVQTREKAQSYLELE